MARDRSFRVAPLVLLLITVATIPGSSRAEQKELKDSPISLKGRHELALYVGRQSQVTTRSGVSGGRVESETRTEAPFGSVSYAYGVMPTMRIGVSCGLIDAGTSASVRPGNVTSEATAVTSVLFGAAYYPPGFTLGRIFRPYGALAIGPYMGSATNSRVTTMVENKTVSETVLGVRGQVGMDVLWGQRIKGGVVAGYRFVGKFDEPIGEARDYSGPELSVGIGVLFGGR